MESLGFTEPVSLELLKHVASKRGINVPDSLDNYKHPVEDFFLQSADYPIFVVADGVSLDHPDHKPYPNPSGAGKAAEIFCRSFVQAAETLYPSFEESDMVTVFRKANQSVGEWNRQTGRLQENINYFDHDFYAATAAGIIVKGQKVHWFSLCDAGIAVIEAGQIIFQSPNGWTIFKKHSALLDKLSGLDRRMAIRRIYRNGVNSRSELIGYGVATGELAAERYLNVGTIPAKKGNSLVIFSDGYEDHLKRSEFVRVLSEASIAELRSNIDLLDRKYHAEDPIVFGHERSLIALKI